MNLLDLLVKVGVKDEASDKIGAISGKIKGGLADAAKAGAAAIGAGIAAAGAGAVALGKQALDAYADYEQLQGGISKLYSTNMNRKDFVEQFEGPAEEANKVWLQGEKAFSIVMDNAQNAYKTTGQSANEYMQNVTRFSAALTNSLGGDTVKAAGQADVAMRAISDNVNTFGTDMESVTQAVQGFAKQNYAMLDNLNLGYGGSKQGMQELIDDANEYAKSIGQSGDLTIESFSDIITAIDLIQRKQNIWGTTSNEAATTIEGSINSTKAAWQNFLTEFGKEDGDLPARIDELMTAAFGDGTDKNPGAFGNIVERVQIIGQKVGEAIPLIADAVGPKIAELSAQLAAFLQEHRPEIEAGAQMMLNALTDVLGFVLSQLPAKMGEGIGMLIATFPQWAPQLLQAAVMLFVNIVQGLTEATVGVLNGMANLIAQVVAEPAKHAGEMLEAGKNLIQGFIDGIIAKAGEVVETVKNTIGGAVDTVMNFLQIGSPSKLFAEIGGYTMEGMANGIERSARLAVNAMGNAAQGVYGAGAVDSPLVTMNAQGNAGIMGQLQALGDNMSNLSVYLDGKTLVGGIAPRMDMAIGRL